MRTETSSPTRGGPGSVVHDVARLGPEPQSQSLHHSRPSSSPAKRQPGSTAPVPALAADRARARSSSGVRRGRAAGHRPALVKKLVVQPPRDRQDKRGAQALGGRQAADGLGKVVGSPSHA